MNTKELFETLSVKSPEQAQIVGRNILSQNPHDVDFAEHYLCFCIENIVSHSKSVSDFFVDESERVLQHISEVCEMTEDNLEKISFYSNKITDREQEADDVITREVSIENNQNIQSIEKEYEKLRYAKEKKPQLDEIDRLDSLLVKDMFTDVQQASYDAVIAKITQLVADKAKQDAKERNQKALNAFKTAFETFNSDSAYKKKAPQLETLVKKYLCEYDINTLAPEVVMYYNYVYNYIFSKLKDELKYKMVEFTIQTK